MVASYHWHYSGITKKASENQKYSDPTHREASWMHPEYNLNTNNVLESPPNSLNMQHMQQRLKTTNLQIQMTSKLMHNPPVYDSVSYTHLSLLRTMK